MTHFDRVTNTAAHPRLTIPREDSGRSCGLRVEGPCNPGGRSPHRDCQARTQPPGDTDRRTLAMPHLIPGGEARQPEPARLFLARGEHVVDLQELHVPRHRRSPSGLIGRESWPQPMAASPRPTARKSVMRSARTPSMVCLLITGWNGYSGYENSSRLRVTCQWRYCGYPHESTGDFP